MRRGCQPVLASAALYGRLSQAAWILLHQLHGIQQVFFLPRLVICELTTGGSINSLRSALQYPDPFIRQQQ